MNNNQPNWQGSKGKHAINIGMTHRAPRFMKGRRLPPELHGLPAQLMEAMLCLPQSNAAQNQPQTMASKCFYRHLFFFLCAFNVLHSGWLFIVISLQEYGVVAEFGILRCDARVLHRAPLC